MSDKVSDVLIKIWMFWISLVFAVVIFAISVIVDDSYLQREVAPYVSLTVIIASFFLFRKKIEIPVFILSLAAIVFFVMLTIADIESVSIGIIVSSTYLIFLLATYFRRKHHLMYSKRKLDKI